jgi:hypothetical protein
MKSDLDLDKIVDQVPPGFTKHDDDSAYFPKGVKEDTRVSVIIECEGTLALCHGRAESFGWLIDHKPGICPTPAPITHFKVIE